MWRLIWLGLGFGFGSGGEREMGKIWVGVRARLGYLKHLFV